MAKIISCKSCGFDFDLLSPEKRKRGGLINVCVDCLEEEDVVKYAGVQAADGKQSQATILKFNNQKDKERYISFWKNNSGWNKGKSCQLGSHISTDPKIKFETIVAHNPTNHKGKA